MHLELKKSKITDWWIAKRNHKMTFINILSVWSKEELIIVGYYDKQKKEIATSTNEVVLINEKGAVTAHGTFYPWEEAHELYLQFLIRANKENTLIVTNWELKNNRMKADIIQNNVRKKEGAEFDFIPKQKGIIFWGYSEELHSKVLVTTFSRRNVRIILGIPKEVMDDIYYTSFALEEESKRRIETIRNMMLNSKEEF